MNKIKTPYFSLSADKVLQQHSIVKNLGDIVSYSSKTNKVVSQILEKETDCMFSLHTDNELKNIKCLSRVSFIAQGWNIKKIKDLAQKGIRWFVVDNEIDLDVFLKFLANWKGDKLNLFLRWRLKENSIRTEKYYVFGMKTEIIKKRVNELKENNKLDNLGIHFHRKSQNIAEWNLQYEIENCFENDLLRNIDIINIGGGIPSVYANTNINVFQGIFDKIKKLKIWLNKNNIRLMIEPGRFISAPSCRLHTKIINIHENTIIVDASVYNGDLDALIVPVKLLVENELPKTQGRQYIIKGLTPCSMDIFRYRVYLPEKKIGDEIVFINAGAYNFNSDFCDLKPIKTIIEKNENN